ncbi:f-box domain containing protein [Stemphylium lycopersici]|nr:f-box domain containing protein [Stemphylium lycopersici]
MAPHVPGEQSSGTPTMPSPLLSLPSELLQHILGYLNLSEILTAGLVCRALHEHTEQDILWQPFVQAEVPGRAVSKPAHLTWQELFKEHHPYWFIARRKVWFADNAHTGKLVVARYDHRLNSIEAYALVAERRVPASLSWDQHPEAIIHTFSPHVQLDLNAPVVRLNKDAYEEAVGRVGYRLQKEIPMSLYHERSRHAALYSQLLLTRPWPANITTEATPVWPPLTLPSVDRTRNDQSPSGFTQSGQKPGRLEQLSTSTFRLRKWMQFSTQTLGMNMRIGEDITTWGTLPEESYTPTRQKPWQGIWCGDYAGHGCEFLAIMQPDDPRPLPERAEWALRAREREGSVSSGGSWTTAPTDAASSDNDDDDDEMENADDLEDSVATLQEAYHERSSGSSSSNSAPQDDDFVYRGRLEAVKLTGDPNIPRGEYTFIAPDIGPNGLLRVANEEIFKGARIVRSVGHIAATGFRDDNYMPSQLILISHDRIAQYWETFGHVSFYQRVDIDAFTRV